MELVKLWREAIVVIVGGVVVGAVLKFADIPTRVSVLETKQSAIEQAVSSIDGKLDILIQRSR